MAVRVEDLEMVAQETEPPAEVVRGEVRATVWVREAVEVPAGPAETVQEAAPVAEVLMMADPRVELDEEATTRCRDNARHTRDS